MEFWAEARTRPRVTLPNTASFGARILRRPDFTGPPICLLLRRWADGFGRRLQSRSESLTRSAQRSESLVMKADDARRLLASANEEDPIVLTEAVLAKLQIDDVPDGASFQVGTHKDNAIHLAWNGTIHRHGNRLFGEADHTWTGKYWYSPLGLEQYLDLVRRAVEARHRTRGDVELSDFDDDGAYISLRFRIDTIETGLGAAYGAVRKIADEVEEAAAQAADEVGRQIAEIAARLSGWGSGNLDTLVDAVASAASTDDKGRSLEELTSRLFDTIPGFLVTGRVRTATEEIDVSVLNDSDDPRLRREGALILAECKNWTGKCGKNEFVLFRSKLENRSGRATVGFLVSWNGFAETITKEMLRGSREEILVVPMTGEDIRRAIRTDGFKTVMLSCWNDAVSL